jgi:hypothetical protein
MATVDMTPFWNLEPCNFVDRYPEDGSSRFFQNVYTFSPNNMPSHPKRKQSFLGEFIRNFVSKIMVQTI